MRSLFVVYFVLVLAFLFGKVFLADVVERMQAWLKVLVRIAPERDLCFDTGFESAAPRSLERFLKLFGYYS